MPIYRMLAIVLFVVWLSSFLVPAPSALVRPGDSNGCSGIAHQDPQTGEWYLTCSGASCGEQENLPCAQLAGGAPGANFIFCGCQDGGPITPTCCFVAISSAGFPYGNGLCRGMRPPGHQGPWVGDNCPGGNDCNAKWVNPSDHSQGKHGVCQTIYYPPPPQ